MLSSILNSTTENITILEIAICTLSSFVLGILVAVIHMYRNTFSKNFIVTLAILPVLVQSVIMLVNGNLGTGVAVLGAFSLIRFRSVPGGAREITSIFWSMGIGLATGMGYVAYAAIYSIITAILILSLITFNFGTSKSANRQMKIVIPENLDYDGIFDDVFKKYTYEANLDHVKTTSMGSLYELSYTIVLKDSAKEKKMIDSIRTRNGNLPITCGKLPVNREEL